VETDAKLVKTSTEQVGALAAALQAYISQAPPPPPKPVIPTTEYLTEELEDEIISSINKRITPTLANIRDEISSMLEKESSTLYQNLWPKIELVLRMVDTVSKGSNTSVEPEG